MMPVIPIAVQPSPFAYAHILSLYPFQWHVLFLPKQDQQLPGLQFFFSSFKRPDQEHLSESCCNNDYKSNCCYSLHFISNTNSHSSGDRFWKKREILEKSIPKPFGNQGSKDSIDNTSKVKIPNKILRM